MASIWDDESGSFIYDGGSAPTSDFGLAYSGSNPEFPAPWMPDQYNIRDESFVDTPNPQFGPLATDSSGSDFWSNLSKSLSGLTSGNLLPTLAQTGLGIYGATQASGAMTDAARQAAAAQQATSLAQIAEQQRQYNQTREDFAPYRDIGTQAANKLQFRNSFKPSGLPGADYYGAPAPQPQMGQLTDESANALMGQQNVTNDQVLLATLKGRLGMK